MAIAGCDLCTINVNIIAPNGTCAINNLDNAGNTFGWGDLDEFVGEELQGCLEFEAPQNIIDYVILSHSGTGGWYMEYMSLYFTSGAVLRCDYNDWLDGSDTGTITCTGLKDEPSEDVDDFSGDDWDSWDF